MKRILSSIIFTCLLAGGIFAQQLPKPASDEDLALGWLEPYLSKVDSVSGEQLKN